mgnify:CR=1 FL=1
MCLHQLIQLSAPSLAVGTSSSALILLEFGGFHQTRKHYVTGQSAESTCETNTVVPRIGSGGCDDNIGCWSPRATTGLVDDFCTIGGGKVSQDMFENLALLCDNRWGSENGIMDSFCATVSAGDNSNTAKSYSATVCGGEFNTTNGLGSSVSVALTAAG